MAWSARVSRWAAPGHVDSAATDDPLLGALPGEFATMNGHFQAVLALPPQATLLAATQRTATTPTASAAARRGIQWHPELDADVLAEYVARSASGGRGRSRCGRDIGSAGAHAHRPQRAAPFRGRGAPHSPSAQVTHQAVMRHD
ncbi:MAG: hypothetical protein R2851_07115 [Caldilineaceae bacterium]